MKIKIHSIDKINEIVWLQVLENCNLKYYMLCDTTYNSNNTISNELRHIYWFRDKEVRKGDWIKLNTRNGTDTSFINEYKSTTHVFYWKLGVNVWNNNHDCAVLFEINTWKTTRVS